MLNRAYTEKAGVIERVLVVAADAAAAGPLCFELMRRGANVSAMAGIVEAADAARRQQFDVILVTARDDANATALFLRMLKAEALGSPRILLLVDPSSATRFDSAIFVSDEMLASSMAPERIADATGIGVEAQAPKPQTLPAVFTAPLAKILALPAGISRDLLPRGVVEAERGEIPDAVILTEPDADAVLSAWMSAATAAVVPIIGVGARADAPIDTLSGLGIAAAIEKVKPLTARMRALPDAYHRTRDPKQMLLARLAVRERGMTASHDPGAKQIVAYRDEAAVGGVLHQAEQLSRLGLLKARFFDKLQCCPGCSSARLLVREECSKCRSADISEEPIIHHLRCGYQGPERDFRQGSELVCPKCRQHCEHFSVDYDKPGALVLCEACGHSTGEAEVGFRCMDCTSNFPSDRAVVRTLHEYDLTEEGRRAAFDAPLSGYGDPGQDERGSLRDRLRRFLRHNAQLGRDCAALMIKVDPDRETVTEIGDRRFNQTLALYSSVLREVFTREVEIIEATTTFLVLIGDEKSSDVATALPEVRRELEHNLSVDLRARYHVFGPDEIGALL